MKMEKYSGLNALLSQNSQAKAYFLSLPDYVQGMIQQRTDRIYSAHPLRRFA